MFLKVEVNEKFDKVKVFVVFKKDNNFVKLIESDFEVLFKDSILIVKVIVGLKVIKGELSILNKIELDNIILIKEIKEKL